MYMHNAYSDEWRFETKTEGAGETLLTERRIEGTGTRDGSGVESAPAKDGRKTSKVFEASLLSTAVLLGTNPVAVKYAVGYVSPLPFAALRFVLAGVVLWVILRLFDPKGRLRREDFGAMAGVGLIGVAMNNVAFTFGVSMTTASNTALIVATAPLWGMLLAFVLGLERPKVKGMIGVGLALLGVGVIVYRGLGTGGTSLPGDLLVMGAAACWGSYAVLSLPLLRRYSPLAVAAYTMLFGGLAILPLASVGLSGMDWGGVSAGGWAAVAYSALLVAAFGFSSWQRGISRIGANRMLVYQYLVTLVGVVAGVVLFDEGFGIDKVLGGVILLSGVYLARRQ
jgi:drug/metabolite transporter (DMT)-like permease